MTLARSAAPSRNPTPRARRRRPRSVGCARALVGLVGLAVLSVAPATAATDPDVLDYSGDTTSQPGSPSVALADEDVGTDDLAGTVVPVDLGSLPVAADVTGYHVAANGDFLFVLDTRTDLGPVVAGRADVVRYDGGGYTIEFDAGGAGVPEAAGVDAVTMDLDGNLILSFDTTVELPGNVLADDDDLVVYDGGGFEVVFDGSMSGVPVELDVDAAHALAEGSFFLSFDTGGEVDGLGFDDDDVLEFDGGAWSLVYDVSAAHAGWGAADLDALFAEVPGGPCGDPSGDGKVSAGDALLVLQAAVGTRACLPCICDVTGDGKVLAADALGTLKYAVGLPVVLNCPPCS